MLSKKASNFHPKIFLKIFLIQVVIFFSLLFVVNLLSGAVLSLYYAYQSSSSFDKREIHLPNFANNPTYARIHFQESIRRSIRYEPYIAWVPNPMRGKSINIDENGDRIHDKLNNDTAKPKSIYFFGGSTIWGYGAWDNDTIPAFFQAISGIPSYNKGKEGHVSRQELARYVSLLVQGEKIDIAIFYDGFNDVGTGCRAELKPTDHLQVTKMRNRLKPEQPQKLWDIFEFLFLSQTKKMAVKINRKLRPSTEELNQDKSYICDNSAERAQQVAMNLVNNWEMAHDIAVARGIKLFAILHPTAHVGNAKVDHIQKYLSTAGGKELGKQLKIVYELIKKIIKERGHEWIFDFTDTFSRNEYIFTGSVHVSPNGNRLIAERLYQEIKEKI